MSVKKKLLLAFGICALAVAGVGAVGALLMVDLSLAMKSPAADADALASRAVRSFVMVATVAMSVAMGSGLLASVWISRRVANARAKAGPMTGRGRDELDDLSLAVGNLAETLETVRKKQISEEELLAAKRYADNIIRSMFDILIVTDPDLNIITVNKAACDLLQYTELELIDQPITSLFKEEPYMLGPPTAQVLKSNQTRDSEMTYLTRSGEQISALVSASTMRDDAGRPLAIITVGKDITTRKQIERDLLEAKGAAESASRAKSAFVANMSHEIRTPMTAILGYADLLTYPDQTAEDRQNCIQTIRRNGQHLLTIINDILDVSKIEAGRMTVERIVCSPCQIVSDVSALMAIRASDKNLTFEVRYSGPIPQTIQSDPTRLRQILMNLLGNAIKFTSKGGIKLVVGMAEPASGQPPQLRFNVVDTGIGLEPDQLASLFRPFVQADTSTTRRFGGTGLGLTISKRLAEMLGGDITVRSTYQLGSTFSLCVETGDLAHVVMLTSPEAIVPIAQASVEPYGEVRLAGRVLVAEDGPDNRTLIRFYLNHFGLHVTLVENGRLACERALAAVKESSPFDLILMDMQMPELDGYAATTFLRNADYKGAIVALTAHAMEGDREKCLACGCDDFAIKPIEPEKLLATIRQYLRPAPVGSDTEVKLDERTEDAHRKPLSKDPLRTKPRLAALVEKFVSGLDHRIKGIEQALAAADAKQLKILAHQLKGAAGGYGFPAISQVAGQLEHGAEKDLGTLAGEVQKLAELCAQARESSSSSVAISA